MSVLQHETTCGLILSNIQERTWTSPERAFTRAIESGRLSEEQDQPNYAGYYMYMGDRGGDALFKHIVTREYLPLEA